MSDLFDQTDAPVVLDDSKDYVAELVGEDKKFKTVSDLAKGKVFSDVHISNLERTLAGLREELQTRKTAEELINQINLAKKPADGERIPDNQDRLNANEPLKSGLTPEDVEALLSKRESQRIKESNLTLASQKLREQHGEAAAALVSTKAAELGVSNSYLRDMASNAPNAFLALFKDAKVEAKTDDVFQAAPQSSFRPNPQQRLTEKWSDFKKVKSENPNLYWSANFQRRLAEAAQKATDGGYSEEFYRS